jgi:hypothetical protein
MTHTTSLETCCYLLQRPERPGRLQLGPHSALRMATCTNKGSAFFKCFVQPRLRQPAPLQGKECHRSVPTARPIRTTRTGFDKHAACSCYQLQQARGLQLGPHTALKTEPAPGSSITNAPRAPSSAILPSSCRYNASQGCSHCLPTADHRDWPPRLQAQHAMHLGPLLPTVHHSDWAEVTCNTADSLLRCCRGCLQCPMPPRPRQALLP